MQGWKKYTGAMLAVAMVALTATGCETSRVSKRHSLAARVSDVTTTGKQDPNFVASGDGQPPVPGSPTAAGANGKQPYSDANARAGAGAEEGMATPPGRQDKDSFQKQ
jgi:hypothetical protein